MLAGPRSKSVVDNAAGQWLFPDDTNLDAPASSASSCSATPTTS